MANEQRTVAKVRGSRISLMILMAVIATLLLIDIRDVAARPWWPVLLVSALFVGSFVVVLLVQSWCAHRECQRQQQL